MQPVPQCGSMTPGMQYNDGHDPLPKKQFVAEKLIYDEAPAAVLVIVKYQTNPFIAFSPVMLDPI